ncbi:N-acetyltransferase [Actinocrinis puniceicyclus]|uniref:N-acetyltransferase n=1 Tax=Actinocrinis puniceicyclus TaxID=977794 RepID=A0A8J7WPX8_9ACTN|nr:N-acetyltransferase [Actinocrinis puniceicyclus]
MGNTASTTATASAPGRPGTRIAADADVHTTAVLGEGTSVWNGAAVREDATLGRSCVVGRGAYLGPGVRVGDNVKIQNYALVYEPAVLGDGVFVGPSVVFTNDVNPRAVTPEGRLKNAEDWDAVGVTVLEGGSVGARAVCVAPVTIGRWAMVAAGAVVTRDVPDFALVLGVPARQVGWVGRAGVRLAPEGAKGDGRFVCPRTGAVYVETDGLLAEAGTDPRSRADAEAGAA